MAVPEFTEITPEGRLRYNFHPGQWRAWESEKRYVVILAGSQGGKTVMGPPWLYREIQRHGPGDYMVVTPTFQLLGKKALPAFRTLFEGHLRLGKYKASPVRIFEFSRDGSQRTFGDTWNGQPTNVFFGHAGDPDSLESATAKAAWLDEAGQNRFRKGSWEAIRRRLAIHQGRVLITTTPYNLGWLKQLFYDPWQRGERDDIDVINFRNIDNPAYPRAEYDAARRELPWWKFNMFYNGLFERPAGLIYDTFRLGPDDPNPHTIPRFAIPRDWKRYVGIDPGGVNLAAVFYAEDPGNKTLYLYREYHAGGKTAAEHVHALLTGEPGVPIAVGGAPSEDQWRREFRAAGLPVRKPAIKEVEVGIDRVYGVHKRDEMYIFDDMSEYLDEKMSYSRKVDDNGDPLPAIQDKDTFHLMDAERYVISTIRRPYAGKQQQSEGPGTGNQRYVQRVGTVSLRGRL